MYVKLNQFVRLRQKQYNNIGAFAFYYERAFCMKNLNKETINWYNKNAEDYFKETNILPMKDKYPQFLQYIPQGGKILDAGCGSGRDAKYFYDMGYHITAFDASEELGKLARKKTGLNIINTTFADFTSEETFDGIWASASLLHVPKKEFDASFSNLIKHLKKDGILYASMKYGNNEAKDSKGRFFNYVTCDELKNIFAKYNNIELIELSQESENTFRVGDFPFIIFILKKT